jgi:hypothetical protein
MKICTKCKKFNPNGEAVCLHCHPRFTTDSSPEKSDISFKSAFFYISFALLWLAITLFILAMLRGSSR